MNVRVLMVVAVMLTATAAFADGVGPGRPMSAPEAAAFRELQETVRAALPVVPAGYTLDFRYTSEFGEGELPAAMKSGEMFRMTFEARYTRDTSADAGQAMAGLMDRAKGTPEQQARLAALEAKQEELKRARNAAPDRAAKDKIRAELQALRDQSRALNDEIMAQYQAWVASGGANAALQSSAAAVPAKEFAVRVLVNGDLSLDDRATPLRAEGVPLAFEQTDGCPDHGCICITRLLGPFAKEKKISGYTGYVLRAAGPGLPTRARGIVVIVSGPAERAEAVRALQKSVDLPHLKSLLAG